MTLEDLRRLFKERDSQLRAMAVIAIQRRRAERTVDPDEVIQRLFIRMVNRIITDYTKSIEIRDEQSFTGLIWVYMDFIIRDILREGPGGPGPRMQGLHPGLDVQSGPDPGDEGWTSAVLRRYEGWFLRSLDQALNKMTDDELIAFHAWLFVGKDRTAGAKMAGFFPQEPYEDEVLRAALRRYTNNLHRARKKLSTVMEPDEELLDLMLSWGWIYEHIRQQTCAALNERELLCNHPSSSPSV